MAWAAAVRQPSQGNFEAGLFLGLHIAGAQRFWGVEYIKNAYFRA